MKKSNICLFVLTWSTNGKKSPFLRAAAHIFVSPGDAPATITQYVARMERQFNVCQTPRGMYLSIFNSFRVIRCLSQCVSPKIAIFTTFLFPLGTPLGQSRWMLYGWKENSMLTNCLAACARLTVTVTEIQRDIGRKSSIFSYPLAFDAPVRGVGIAPPRFVQKNYNGLATTWWKIFEDIFSSGLCDRPDPLCT